MNISTVFDDAGRITAAQEVMAAKGDVNVQLVAGPGQHHAVLTAPSHHHGKVFSDVVQHLKVSGGSENPSLIDR